MRQFAAILCATLGFALLGAAATPAPDAAAKPAIVVHMKNFAFSPAKVSIKSGQTVEWINDDSVQHSATADDHSWNSGELAQGASWSKTFTAAGTYTYYCDDHEFMKAEIDVK
ncbi:MAG TPA: cupredoxin family copper-binding protein [Candidatus Baltobacteraceae bacterium]|jgi:plastocyanin